MGNIEIEYKVMVTKESLDKIYQELESKYDYKFYNQTNYYYDTTDRILKKNNLSLRIRDYGNSNFVITLKEKKLFGNIEHEQKIKENNLLLANEKIQNTLLKNNINVKMLLLLGSLTTKRYEFYIDDCNLCLDYNYYNEMEDFEIECESNSLEKSKKIIDEICQKLNINYKVSTRSKTNRALNDKNNK